MHGSWPAALPRTFGASRGLVFYTPCTAQALQAESALVHYNTAMLVSWSETGVDGERVDTCEGCWEAPFLTGNLSLHVRLGCLNSVRSGLL